MATSPENELLAKESSCFSFLDSCDEKGVQPMDATITAQSRKEFYRPPNSGINAMKDTEDFLAADLLTLSAQERLQALDDVHCVGEELQETPEMIRESLQEFHRLVETHKNPIYEHAVNQNREYVEDSSFRLMFLRANSYNVGQAVNQMMNLLEQKALYFGNDKVAREITLDDLNEEDQKCLRFMGHIQEERDQMGRVVTYWFPKEISRHQPPAESMIRASYYMSFNILFRIPGVQTKGLVSIQYDTNTPREQARLGVHFLRTLSSFAGCLPFRYASTLCCLEKSGESSALYNAFMGFWVRAIQKQARARVRIHYASHMELQYDLRGYGISMPTFPVDLNGDIRGDMKHKWLNDHLQNIAQPEVAPEPVAMDDEQGSPAVEQVAVGGFSDRDVLLGRGRFFQYHPGNIQFRQYLEAHMMEYEVANRAGRRQIATELVRAILASGARFLKLTSNHQWVENDFDDSVKKVAQYFRTLRRSIKRGAQNLGT